MVVRNNAGDSPRQGHGDVSMMDVMGSYLTNNAGMSSPFVERDRRMPFPLHKSSRELLEMMDTIVELF